MKTPPTETHTDYYTAKSIRSAIASELARRVHISQELIDAKVKADEAQRAFREQVRKAIDDQRGAY